MSILKRALGIIVLTVLIAVGTSLTVHYSYDKTHYKEQVHTELQRQSFAIKTELTTVLKTGSASDLRRKLVIHENLFDETEIVVFNGEKLLGSSLTLPPDVELAEHFNTLGLDGNSILDAQSSRLNFWHQGDLHIASIPICMSPLTYSKYFKDLERCSTVLLVKSVAQKMRALQGMYSKIILSNFAVVIFVTLLMALVVVNYWRKRTEPTFAFLETFKIGDKTSKISNEYNDELSVLEGQINNLIERTSLEQSFSVTLIDKSTAVILTEDENFKIMSCSKAWSETTGYTREETIGRDFIDFMTPEHQIKARTVREKFFDASFEERSYDVDIVGKSGNIISLMLNVRADTFGVGARVILTANDITEVLMRQREVEEQKRALEIQAHIDPLTGLLSRLGLTHSEKERSAFGEENKRALYLFDIDFFKSVNDEHSHDIGDQLLCAVADEVCRICSEKDVVCRFGGEEFLILRTWHSEETALEFASDLQKAVSGVTVQSGLDQISRTISIGLVELDAETTIEHGFTLADMALIEAKRQGRNEIVYANNDFIESMRRNGKFITSVELEAALVNNEFKYYCQPIQNSTFGRAEGYEALIRWVKPTGEIVPPSVFLHMFQKVFFDQKFKNVRRKMRKDLVTSFPHVSELYFSWNYDLDQLESEIFVASILDWVRDLRNETACEVVIEISEKALYRDVDMGQVVKNLKRLRLAGIGIALDDFGVEHSNVQRLTELPISVIKLDRCLVHEMDDKPENLSTIRHIANLARELNIKVIAEGVENERQVMLLNQCKIYSHQGYYYSKPYDPKDNLRDLNVVGDRTTT